MPRYTLEAKYTQAMENTARFLIQADSPDEAISSVRKFLEDLPEPQPDKTIKRFLVTNRDQMPVEDYNLEILEIEDDKRKA